MSIRERDSYEAASSDYFGSLMVRKNGKQPARHCDSQAHVDTSSEGSDDSQVFTTPSTSSYLSESPPMDSSFPPTRGPTASRSRHAPLARDYAPSPVNTHHPNTNGPEPEFSTSTPTDPGDFDLYSTAGLPVLDTSLPPSELPDDLIVHDAHDLPYPVRYVRVTPLAKGTRLYAVPTRDPTETDSRRPRRVAQLHLANDNHIHTGNAHSAVFRAPLTLPIAAGSEVATRVRVVAKTPAPVCGSHRQLHQEARMYHAFPRELAEGSMQASPSTVQKRKMSWREQLSRFKLKRTPRNSKSGESRPTDTLSEAPTPAVHSPVPMPHPGTGELPVPLPSHPLRSLPPVVPKFFGYYLLLKPDGQVFFELSEAHGECGEDGTCAVAWPPAIVLIEDCGVPIQPSRFTDAQRYVIPSLSTFRY